MVKKATITKYKPVTELNKKDSKSFSFTGIAKKIKVKQMDEVAVWTDGLMASCDLQPHCKFQFEEGKMYQITIEQVK